MPAHGPSDPNTVATLYFTTHGIILNTRQPGDGQITEYAIDPRSLTNMFSVKDPPPPERKHSTGILLPSTVCITMTGDNKIIVDYREPQITGIWFSGNPQPLLVPLPGLLLIGKSTNGKHRSYSMYAVKERPTSMTCKLYEVPLIHANHGGMCWGNVQIEPEENPISLANAWAAFLGSAFNNHGVGGKSKRKKYKRDIRALLIDLDKRKAQKYPIDDLVEAGNTLENALAGRWM